MGTKTVERKMKERRRREEEERRSREEVEGKKGFLITEF
jgi:hypothetical protein